MADASYSGGSVRAQSGLGQAKTGVQARMRRATAGQRHWRLSRAGRNSGSGSDGGGRGCETQGFAGRENVKWRNGQPPLRFK